MKQSYLSLLLTLSLASSAVAQDLTPYAVVAPCAPSNAPSRLKKIVGTGFVDLGAVNLDGLGITANALGYDSGDPSRLFAIGVNVSSPSVVPLYQISTANGNATNLGLIAPPPVPVTNANGVGQSVVFNLIGDGSDARKYYVLGLSARVGVGFVIKDPTLYVGEIDLSAAVVSPVPIWRAATLDAAAAAVVDNIITQSTAYFLGTGPLPAGGIQDWLFDPASGHLISYLGIEQKFLTVSSIGSAPAGTVTVPSSQIPVSREVGGLYRDNMNNVFAIVSDNGAVYQIDRLTGNYTGTTFNLPGGCLRGDAATAPSPITLPVELTGFTAKATKGAVELAWQTASESDVAYFRVERQSTTESRETWRAVDSVAAQNSARGATYRLRDAAPNAARLRYRLAIRDNDGSIRYSGSVEVRFTAPAPALVVYPNPATDECLLTMNAPVITPGLLQVFNALGTAVAQQPLTAGISRLQTAHLPPGIYTVVATMAGARQTQRLVIGR